MGVFLYYLPDVTRETLTREQLKELPCARALADCLRTQADFQNRLAFRDVHANGPDGGNGLIVVPLPINGEEPRIGMFPAWQTWKQCGPIWLGTDNDFPPTPEDLVRPHLVEGHAYQLGDDQTWECPVVRRPNGLYAPGLPQTWGVNAEGKFVSDLVADYRWIWSLAGRAWDAIASRIELETPEIFSICVDFLSINYRIGPHEATRLCLINNENYVQVFQAAVDGPLIKELMESVAPAVVEDSDKEIKKKDSGAVLLSSSPGSADATLNIAPAGENTGS